MQRIHINSDLNTLTDVDKLLKFATEAYFNRLPVTRIGVKEKKKKYSKKIIGQTFEK